MVKTKRVYETPVRGDGVRVLVDQLWPRGLTKERAQIDIWVKSLAPSDALRKWYAHDPARWQEFRKRYILELHGHAKKIELSRLLELARTKHITLVYAAKDSDHSNAVVLAGLLGWRP